MTDLKAVATEVSTVDEAVLKALPFISAMIGFVPGGAVAVPFLPIVSEALTALDNAAKAVAGGNTGAALDVVLSEVKKPPHSGRTEFPGLVWLRHQQWQASTTL